MRRLGIVELGSGSGALEALPGGGRHRARIPGLFPPPGGGIISQLAFLVVSLRRL